MREGERPIAGRGRNGGWVPYSVGFDVIVMKSPPTLHPACGTLWAHTSPPLKPRGSFIPRISMHSFKVCHDNMAGGLSSLHVDQTGFDE